jgi:membrane-associated phospholipid phosphatase
MFLIHPVTVNRRGDFFMPWLVPHQPSSFCVAVIKHGENLFAAKSVILKTMQLQIHLKGDTLLSARARIIRGSLFFISLLFIFFAQAQNADINLLKKINGSETAFKNDFFRFQSASLYPVTAVVPLGQFVTGIVKKDPAMKKQALWTTGTFATTFVLTRIVKWTVKRQRPFATYSFIEKRDNVPDNKSFFSGHASTSFCTATWLALNYKKWYVVAPAYLWAGGVSYARMYLGVHYPSDVLTGALVGSGVAWLGYKMKQRHDRKHKKTTTGTPRF